MYPSMYRKKSLNQGHSLRLHLFELPQGLLSMRIKEASCAVLSASGCDVADRVAIDVIRLASFIIPAIHIILEDAERIDPI